MIASDKANLIIEIDKSLDEIRPHLNEDFGDVEVVNITDEMVLEIRWLGNCESCKMSDLTLKAGIESVVRNKFPVISSVVAVN